MRGIVFDFETTGLSAKFDRVIEIGAVELENGSVVRSWTTLIDPDRDIGLTRLHGITAGMVNGAPMFADVAGGKYVGTHHVGQVRGDTSRRDHILCVCPQWFFQWFFSVSSHSPTTSCRERKTRWKWLERIA